VTASQIASDIASLVWREELDEITRSYRRIAGFDVEPLNRKSQPIRRPQAAAV
jgi:hypothetical protein